MASLVNRIWTRFRARKSLSTVMIVGLDNSGKTSVLNCLVSAGASANQERDFSRRTPGRDKDNLSGSSKALDDQSSASQIQVLGSTSSSSQIRHQELPKFSPGRGRDRNIMPTVGYNYERVQFKNLSLTVLDFSGQTRFRNLWQEFYNGVDAIVFVIDSSDLIRLVVVKDELETLLSHPFFDTLGPQKLGDQPFASTGVRNPMLVQKQYHISQGKLVQAPLDSSPAPSLSCKSKHRNRGRDLRCDHTKTGLRTRIPILFLANKSDLANSVDTEVIAKALNLSQLPSDRHPWHIQASSVTSNLGISEGFQWLIDKLAGG